MFVLNNGKFDPRSDKGVFVGYSLSSKAYRVFNKTTQCIEESIHVVFDEDGSLKSDASNDEDELIKRFNSQKIEGSEACANDKLRNDNDNDNHSLSKMTNEVEKCDEGPGTTLNSSQSTSNSPENDELIEEEEHADQLNKSTLRPGW